MPKPYDASTKHLLETRPEDWLEYLGLPRGAVELINADLSTVTAAADKVMRVLGPPSWLAHVEPQAGPDPELDARVLEYNVLLDRRHSLPVQSIVVLLRPSADRPGLTGRIERHLPSGRQYLAFEYDVVRVWQKPVESVLAGGLGTLPLAPLADVPEGELPGVLQRMEERISREATPDEAGLLWTTALVLLGLRCSRQKVSTLMKGVRGMRESTTYMAIIEEGRMEEARTIVLRQGTKRFGPPSTAVRTSIEAITGIERLETLADRLLDVENWEELLAD
jgi:predicted transposase YdaD